MQQIIKIIENHVGTFSDLSSIDAHIIAHKTKKILKERGYALVENIKEAENYFAKKYGKAENSYEVNEFDFNIAIRQVAYHIKLYQYTVDFDQVYSLSVTEL